MPSFHAPDEKSDAKQCLRRQELNPYEVHCVQIEYSKEKLESDEKEKRKEEKKLKSDRKEELESGKTESERKDSTKPRSNINARIRGPLLWLTVLGSGFSVVLLILSTVSGDGMSFCATISLSLLSTIAGVANRCELKLSKREKSKVPPGDTVIRYPNGSFIVVKCEENVARELFFAPEELEYHIADQTTYRLISLVGTVFLMAGIIFLANATLTLQIGWAIAYGLINAAYWVVAALSPRRHWDFSAYALHDIGLASDASDPVPEKTVRKTGLASDAKSNTFTIALWKAIVLTKTVDWVRLGDAAPSTPVWNAWISWAEQQVHKITPAKRPGNLRKMYDRPPATWRSDLRKMYNRARARGNGNDTVSDAQVWNDDLDGAEPLKVLIRLLQQAEPVLDADGMPPAPPPQDA